MELSINVGHQAVGNALQGLNGFGRRGIHRLPQGDPNRLRAYEAARLVADAIAGRVDPYWVRAAMQPPDQNHIDILRESGYGNLYPTGVTTTLRETMSRTDYQALFADVLDILYYGYFNAFPIFNEAVCRIQDLADTRFVKRYMLDGLVTPAVFQDLAAPANQQALSGPVPQDNPTFPTTNTAAVEYQPALMQTKASINWSAILNDNLGIFQDVPKRIVISINRGITIFIHSLYAGNGVLNTTLFQSGYNNVVTIANGASMNNPPLGAQGIMDATKILAGQRDSSGQPIMMGGMGGRVKIVFGSANIAVAKNLQNATRNQISVEGGSQNAQGFPQQWIETNTWFNQNTDWIHDPYMDNGSSAAGFSSLPGGWFMFADPGMLERPAIEIGYLRGFRQAQLFQKVPNTMRPGGGVEPMMGDWSTMNQEMKAISVLGGAQMDGRSCTGSTGLGV
jgi:hypothetical protein